MNLVPVILCGGSGSRLWPLSRSEAPKQFMELNGSTLFGDTVQRAAALPGVKGFCICCNEKQRFFAAAILQGLHTQAALLLEPQGRNTAPAIAVAAFQALEDAALARPDQGDGAAPLLLVLPSDHIVQPQSAFAEAVNSAATLAAEGYLVTFGIAPQGPETGFGYILHGQALGQGYAVQKFEEKPCLARAEALLHAGGCSWNSGMFLFRADRYLEELKNHAPQMYAACAAIWASRHSDHDFTRFDPALFAACPSNSIDYAVMEHTSRAAVLPLEIEWSDLGSWQAFYNVSPKDATGNACVGDVLLQDSHGSYLHSTSRLIAGVGLEDMVVVESPDAVLVAPRGRVQDVRRIQNALQAAGRNEAHVHTRVHRPWGSYESLARGQRFQVKRIEVSPGASLSLQKHHHRAEHWVVVRGTAEITRDGQTFLMSEDKSTYIPLGGVHRLHNPGRIPLEIIEIQTGSYLGEDDIVRLEDNYGRLPETSHQPSPE